MAIGNGTDCQAIEVSICALQQPAIRSDAGVVRENLEEFANYVEKVELEYVS